LKRGRKLKKRNTYLRTVFNRRGDSTVEYVIVIAAALILASALMWAINNQTGALKEKVAAVLKGEELQIQPSGEPGGKEMSPLKQAEITRNHLRIPLTQRHLPKNLPKARDGGTKRKRSQSLAG
jgi:hypothetical protein